MAALTLVSPAEYLRTPIDGLDREYVDGELVERSMPTYLHSKVQAILCALFLALGRRFPIFPAPELRLAIGSQRLYRIPDVSDFTGDEPNEPVPSNPPLVAIEILSPDDRLAETLKKFDEYHQFGVAHIWLIDPVEKKFYTFDASGLHPVAALNLPQFDFALTFTDLGL